MKEEKSHGKLMLKVEISWKIIHFIRWKHEMEKAR